MSMFCYQCQEAANGVGCSMNVGVCGKSEEVSHLQDLLVYITQCISQTLEYCDVPIDSIPEINHIVLQNLFMTITNANFNNDMIEAQIKKSILLFSNLSTNSGCNLDTITDTSLFSLETSEDILEKSKIVGVLSTENEDIRSLRQIIIYGIKGMAAYLYHALQLGKEDVMIYNFLYEALSATLNDSLKANDLIDIVLKTGEKGVAAMALLDAGNTEKFGNPVVTNVKLGVGKNPGILISGHDLHDLEQLLEQTQGSGVDVYTHCEMLPAHYYPFFKKYDNLVGNYGNAWWKQLSEFESFNGPILFTTNCIVPRHNETVSNKIFTTGVTGYKGCRHIEADENGKKDFSSIIELAKQQPVPKEIESGTIVGGFAHNQVLELADKVVQAVKSGAIKKFFVMAGCDGRMKSREYFTEFAEKLPKDTVILTAGCAKYRYNKLNLGNINGIPRVLDAGQCNDCYSLAVIALKLKEVFDMKDINDLPIIFNIAWYEQKAVIVLLALLYLGVKNIHLGPTLPAFLSPNVTSILVEKFGIKCTGMVDTDIEEFMVL